MLRASTGNPLSDATSVSVLESMACGLAVVASDLSANRHWLGVGPELLAPGAGAAELAEVLAGLWRDDERARELGRRNHERIVAEGDRRTQMDRMLEAYRALASGPAASR